MLPDNGQSSIRKGRNQLVDWVLGFARKHVAEMPPAISGKNGHDTTFAVACDLTKGFMLDFAEAKILMREYNQRCQPPWSDQELDHKLKDATRASGKKDKGKGYLLDGCVASPDYSAESVEKPTAPVINPAANIEEFLKGFRCDASALSAASPIHLPADWRHGGLLLVEHLYGEGDLINYVTAYKLNQDGKANPANDGLTCKRNDLLKHMAKQGTPQNKAGAWLRMNPVRYGGVSDKHVTSLWFALLEFDDVPLELQISLVAKLPLPISAILTSGGRSIHTWVKVDCDSLEEYSEHVPALRSMLARFGVDPKNKNPSRLSRFPGAQRTIGAHGDGRQELLYLNPQPTEKSIL